jgi:murein L,D-transpeptidase YcbB/YkuD
VRGKAIWSSESESFLRSKIMTGFHQIADGKPIDLVLSSLQPKSYNYEQLSNALKKFELPEKWPETESIIKINDQTPKMVLTVMQLAGFFKGDVDNYIDQYPLIVKSYQQYYHLPQDELLSTTTNAHLMQQVYHKFMVMAVNIERLRQNPPLSNYYLLVNLPAYQLTIFDNGSPIKKIRVIVGSPKTPTPILSGLLTHVVTYPKWNIPPSIVTKEIIPAIKRDSMYLKRKGYYLTNWQGEVLDPSKTKIDSYTDTYYPFNIAQGSGSDNALGTLKFLFKNDYDIYLHDTNSRSLFQRKERAMSHGCIRVENPEDLAKYVLSERSLIAMQKQMEKKQTGHLAVEKEIMVYIRYLTCEADKAGNVSYFKDVYQLDQKDWNLMMGSLYSSSLLTAMKQHH